MHNGTRETFTELRANYWVTKERQTVKRLVSKCIVCKKIQGKAYFIPPEPPLPDFRVSEDLAFSKTAVDFVGVRFTLRTFMIKRKCFTNRV